MLRASSLCLGRRRVKHAEWCRHNGAYGMPATTLLPLHEVCPRDFGRGAAYVRKTRKSRKNWLEARLGPDAHHALNHNAFVKPVVEDRYKVGERRGRRRTDPHVTLLEQRLPVQPPGCTSASTSRATEYRLVRWSVAWQRRGTRAYFHQHRIHSHVTEDKKIG